MKCGYTRMANLVPVAECPRCGAIYAKVAAAVAQGRPVHRVRTSGFGTEAEPMLRKRARLADGPASIPASADLHPISAEQAVLLAPALPSPSTSLLPPSDRRRFVERLRSESLYPNYRTVVNVAFWLGVVIAVLCVVGGVVTSKGTDTLTPLLIATAAALGWMVLVVLAREAALMLADLSDAAIRIALAQEKPVAVQMPGQP